MAKSRGSSKKLQEELTNFNSFQQSQIDALNSIAESLNDTMTTTANVRDSIASLSSAMNSMVDDRRRREREAEEERNARKVKESSDKVNSALKALGSRLLDLTKIVADTANKYSQISNDLISVTGATGLDVRATRSEIVHDIVSQINKETGGFLNPEKSYQKVVDIANQANIGNLEAIEEITRPILLASESMNVNNGELASLMNKWYTRYNFSSLQMESMVDEIRGNTAGNNATAEATLENISKFQNFIGVYADSTEEMQNMVEAISEESSRLESVGINSGYIFDYMKQIGQGDLSNSTAIMSMLSNSGTGMTWTEAQKLLRSGESGDMKLVSEALASGAQAIGEKLKDSTMTAEAIKNYGLDVEEIYNILSASGALMTSEEFEDSVSGAQTAVESIDDKFNTWQDKATNWFSGIGEYFANLQETVGVGLSDLIWIGTGIYAAVQTGKLFGKLNGSSLAGVGGSSSGGAASILSGISAGTVATAAGVAAGGLLTVDGIRGMMDEGSSNAEKSLSLIEATGGTAGVAGLIALGATNPVGWVALAIGGLGYLGKKAYENAHELSGNAEQVNSDIEKIGDSLKSENKSRMKKLGDLQYQFDQESNVSDKRRLMEESGIFSQEELNKTSDNELQNLIDSYKNAAKAFDDTTDEFLKKASDKYAEEQDKQQKDFVTDLYGLTKNEDRLAALNILEDSITDPKILKKIEKAKKASWLSGEKENEISYAEWQDILSGGANSWFDKNNLTDQGIAISGMQDVSGWFGWGKDYITTGNMDEVAKLYSSWRNAATETAAKKAWEEIKSSEYYDELMSLYGDDVERVKEWRGYATGSNYIDSDQTARIHEGEAVVPKKYNPAANVTELEMLREYYKSSVNKSQEESKEVMKEMASVLVEIKDFLSEWKDDNVRRDNTTRRSARFANNAAYLSHYMTT